jgi:hypothetical protein
LLSAPIHAAGQQPDQAIPSATPGASFTGFVEAEVFAYPRRVTGEDDSAAAWLTLVARHERRLGPLRLAGSFRAEKITSGEQRGTRLDLADRLARRPVFSIPEAWASVPLFPAVEAQAGRFDVAWGRTDGYSPADAFLPRDLSDPFSDERLPLWGARVLGERGPVRFELFHSFTTTPWRLPVMSGRLSPVWYADFFLLDAEERPPTRGFDVARVTVSGHQWDLGGWVRTGVRPAPVIVPLREQEEPRAEGTFVPLARRFAPEDAYGIEIVRGQGSWIARGELAYSTSRDPDVGTAVIWTLSVERPARQGAIMVTVAGNAIEPPINPLLLFDRAFLPHFIATSTQLEPWGSWRVLWLGTFRRVGGILELEVSRDLTDALKATIGADLPHGSQTSSPGAISRARRVHTGARWSW